MLITNNYGLPQALVDIVKSDEKESQPKKYGVTTILKPTREIILKRRHQNEISVDVSDCVNQLFGKAFHSLIEHHDTTGNSELELEEYVIDDYKLVGRLDLYDDVKKCIIDYKTATCWKVMFKDFEDWRKQGLLYAWLCLRNGRMVNKVIFYAFLKDWTPKEKRKQGKNYPESQIFTYEFDITIGELMKIEDWLSEKFQDIIASEKLSDSELPICSDEDCWYTGNKYAVYKKEGQAKADRVLDSEEEAHDYITNKLNGVGRIEFRKGEYRKCQDYCEVCNFCKYYKERGGK